MAHGESEGNGLKRAGGLAALVGLLGGGVGGVSGWQIAERTAKAIVADHRADDEHGDHAPLWQRYNDLQRELATLRERVSRLEGQIGQ